MFEFLHTFSPNPIAFEIGSFGLHWYGIFAAVGIAAAWYTIERLQKKYQISVDLFPLFIGATFWGLVGARLYHVVNELPFYLNNPILIPQVWIGGLALHGGILGAFIFTWYWVKKKNLSFGRILDIFATGGILIQIFGRVGNYFNQELYGKPTDLAWGIPIEPINRLQGYEAFHYFHPTFLYEAILNSILFLLLLALHKGIFRGRIRLTKGYIFLVYLVFYSLIRGSLEFIRIDTTPILFGARLPIIVSAFILVVIILIFITRNKFHEENFHN